MRCSFVFSLAALAGILVGCSSSSVRLSQDWDDPADEDAALEAQSPEGFVDRLGEPDSWNNEGEGNDLKMTAVWNCVDGRRREVVWKQQDAGGLSRWVVVSDTSREGCEE